MASRSAGSSGGVLDALAGGGVHEGEALGVEERSAHRQRWRGAAVAGVADDRVADRGEVHPDLVGAPGLEPATQLATPRPAR